jgi:hypothetical protein
VRCHAPARTSTDWPGSHRCCRREVGDDVAEQIVGDDDVEAAGVGDHVDGRRVDVLIGDFDVGEVLADLGDGPRPQRAGERQHVGLVHQRQVLAPLGRPAERVTHHALHAERGVQAHLGGHFVRGADADRAARAGVWPLGALAHDHEVDGGIACQRAVDTRKQPRRTQIDVMVELEAQPEQQPALQYATGHRRITDGTQQDRVVPAQLGGHAVGQRLPRCVVALGTQVVGRLLDTRQDDVEHLEGFGDDLGSDAVSGDYGQFHVRSTSSRVTAPTSVPIAASTSADT